MAHSNVLAVCTIILIANVLCNNKFDQLGLVVGPRRNETGRYIYNSKTDTDTMTSLKHCRYCDNDLAFKNTNLNRKHQEAKCVQYYLKSEKINVGLLSEYERTNKLYPYCKLGAVPGCGPHPNTRFEQYCDPGYSNVLYSVYFSCVTSNNETGKLQSVYYCNEMLQWEFMGEYNDTATIRSPTLVKTPTEMTVIVTKEPDGVTAEEKLTTEMEESDKETTANYVDRNSEENTNSTVLYMVIIIVACVLVLITIGMTVALVLYLCKRRQRVSFPVSSNKPSPLSPQFVRCPKELGGEDGPCLSNSDNSYTSNESGESGVKGENAFSIVDMETDTGVQRVENTRTPPLGQETVPLLSLTSNKTQPTTTANPTVRPLSPGFISCPAGIPRHNGDIRQASNPATNIQHQTRDSNKVHLPSRPAYKEADDHFYCENSTIDNRRQEPIGKASKPRHEDVEENSHNTEPKQVVSIGFENDASFEIGGADSGINLGASLNTMNAEVRSLRMNNLK